MIIKNPLIKNGIFHLSLINFLDEIKLSNKNAITRKIIAKKIVDGRRNIPK